MMSRLILASVVAIFAVSALAGCSKNADQLNGPPTASEKKTFNGGPMPEYAKKQMADWFAKHAAATKAATPVSGTAQ